MAFEVVAFEHDFRWQQERWNTNRYDYEDNDRTVKMAHMCDCTGDKTHRTGTVRSSGTTGRAY